MRCQTSLEECIWESSLHTRTCSGNCTEVSIRSLCQLFLFDFILWEVALHSDSDYKGVYKSWISALAVSRSPQWGLCSPYFVQLLPNADKIPPSNKATRRKQRQRTRASGGKWHSLHQTPWFETLAEFTEVIIVIWLINIIYILSSLFLKNPVISIGFLSFCVDNVTAQFSSNMYSWWYSGTEIYRSPAWFEVALGVTKTMTCTGMGIIFPDHFHSQCALHSWKLHLFELWQCRAESSFSSWGCRAHSAARGLEAWGWAELLTHISFSE